MKIEEGMYVRTKKGEIKKILQYDEQKNNLMWCTLNHCATIKSSIIKASYNIIDLIEAGDYVNGNKVIRIETSSYPEDKNVKIIVCCGDDDYYVYYNEDIKTILTKEQYENNCYKVEE